MISIHQCSALLFCMLNLVVAKNHYDPEMNFDIFASIKREETTENYHEVLGVRHKINEPEDRQNNLWWSNGMGKSKGSRKRNLRTHHIVNEPTQVNKNPHILPRKLRTSLQSQRKTIIGGKDALPNRYPYAVTLQYFYKKVGYDHNCGASLIAPDIVLSAAHCYTAGDSYKLPRVIVGDHDLSSSKDNGEKFSTELLTFHPHWDERLAVNDLVLFKLRGNSTKTPVRLNRKKAVPSANQTLVVMGWGSTDPHGTVYPTILKETTKEYLPNEKCFGMEDAFKGILCSYDFDGKVDEDSCAGDSGGPIIVQGTKPSEDIQVGLSSYGAFPCAQGKPTYWVRISDYYDWIREQVCASSLLPPDYFDCSSTNESEQPSDSNIPNDERAVYTLSIRLDKYPQFITWKIYDDDSGYLNPLYSNSHGYSKDLRSSTVHETLYLEKDKAYHFSIHDIWEDWMCCEFGRSYYYLTLGTEENVYSEDNVVFWGEGVFGTHGQQETFIFDSTKKIVEESNEKQIGVTSQNEFVTVQILFDNYPYQIDWSISNEDLSVVYKHKVYGSYVASAGQLISEVVYLPHSQPLKFMLNDKVGDGLLDGGFVRIFEGSPEKKKLLFEVSAKFIHQSFTFELKEKNSIYYPEVSSPTQIKPISKVALTLRITFDYYPEHTVWAIYEAGDTNKQNPLYKRVNGYPSHYKLGAVIETIHLEPNKNFIFTIGDYFGNGMCCQYGNGTYTLHWGLVNENIDTNKIILYGYDDFETYVDRNFTTSRPSIPTSSPTVSLSPSSSLTPSVEPTSVDTQMKVPLTLVIKFDKYPKDVYWAIFPVDPENDSPFFSGKDALYKTVDGYTSQLKEKFVYETLYLEPDKQYDLVMIDLWGDGICCDYGKGFYFLYWGIEENNEYEEESKIISSNGEYDKFSVHSFKTMAPTSLSSTFSNDDYDYDYYYY